MKEDLFTEAKKRIAEAGLTLLGAENRAEMQGSWCIIVASSPVHRLFWDRQSGWLVLEEEISGLLNGPRVWKDVWMGQNLDRESLDRGISVLLKRCAGR